MAENQESPAEVENTEAQEVESAQEVEASEDGFKSEESKRSVLADLARERKSRQALESKLKEYEDANKTELEKAQAAATEAQEQLAALRQDALRNQIALDDGLDADLAALLHGSEEEMREQSRIYKERLNSQPKTPRPDPSQGAKGKASAGSTADQFADFFNNSLTNS